RVRVTWWAPGAKFCSRVADSDGLAGASPFCTIYAAPVWSCQLPLLAMRVREELYTLRTGSASTPESPRPLSDGPSARSTTLLGPGPVTIKPPIRTLSPTETSPRVERLSTERPTVG